MRLSRKQKAILWAMGFIVVVVLGITAIINIEIVFYIVGPPCSISMFVWVSQFFVKSPQAKQVRDIAFKIWAVCLLLISVTLSVNGLLWNLKEHGIISLKVWGLFFLMIGLIGIYIKFYWNIMQGK
jgi:hypothetical protein